MPTLNLICTNANSGTVDDFRTVLPNDIDSNGIAELECLDLY
jgi:hypothetical protein